jgi:hypothetical protein
VPSILRRLPIFEQATTLSVPGGPVVSGKPFQVVCWVSLTAAGLPVCPPGARRFPVVLDTGFNDNFLIQEQQFVAWAGLSVQGLDAVGFLSVYSKRAALLGVRALKRNSLKFFLDGSRGLVWMRTRRRFWFFGW